MASFLNSTLLGRCSSPSLNAVSDFPAMSATFTARQATTSITSCARMDMFEDIKDTLENGLGSHILPSRTASDVQAFRNIKTSSEGSVILRAGANRNFIDRVLYSRLHVIVPNGSMDFLTAAVLMGPQTDIPHLLLEFKFLGNDRMNLVCDFLPRKDLVEHLDYLDTYYESSNLSTLFHKFENDPRMERYTPKSLYVRVAFSPTACLYNINPSKWNISEDMRLNGSQEALDSTIQSLVRPMVMELLETWIELTRTANFRALDDVLRPKLARDKSLIENVILRDLSENLPSIFEPEIVHRIVEAYKGT